MNRRIHKYTWNQWWRLETRLLTCYHNLCISHHRHEKNSMAAVAADKNITWRVSMFPQQVHETNIFDILVVMVKWKLTKKQMQRSLLILINQLKHQCTLYFAEFLSFRCLTFAVRKPTVCLPDFIYLFGMCLFVYFCWL